VRQIGPSIFVGDDPLVCFQAAAICEESQRRSLYRETRQRCQSPSDKFLSLLNERMVKPKRYGFIVDHSYFRFGDHTLICVSKADRLSGVPDCRAFMVQLKSIYVVDTARGAGNGTLCIDTLTEIAEEAGCVLALFCNPFVWSCDGINQYAIESFDQLWDVVFNDKWDVLYHRDSQHELTKFFYQRSGFTNICLYDDWVYKRDKSDDLPFEQQFAYLPSSLKPEYRQQLEIRLKSKGCDFCNRQ
jgi:GNAT superfamily N-acetyltransferase